MAARDEESRPQEKEPPGPGPDFANSTLRALVLPTGAVLGRIFLAHFPDPLGIGPGESRFSDPRTDRPDDGFRVLYLGETLETCFLETVVRDRRDGIFGDLVLAAHEIGDRDFAMIRLAEPMTLVDLTQGNAVAMGIPSDVHRHRNQEPARQ